MTVCWSSRQYVSSKCVRSPISVGRRIFILNTNLLISFVSDSVSYLYSRVLGRSMHSWVLVLVGEPEFVSHILLPHFLSRVIKTLLCRECQALYFDVWIVYIGDMSEWQSFARTMQGSHRLCKTWKMAEKIHALKNYGILAWDGVLDVNITSFSARCKEFLICNRAIQNHLFFIIKTR